MSRMLLNYRRRSRSAALLHLDGANGSTSFADEVGGSWASVGSPTISWPTPARVPTPCRQKSPRRAPSWLLPRKSSNWNRTKQTGERGVGFIAHELQEVSPSSVTAFRPGRMSTQEQI